MTEVDMSPEAITARMIALDQLYELSIALKSSEIIPAEIEKNSSKANESSNEKEVSIPS